MPVTLSLVEVTRTGIAADAIVGQMVGSHLRLLEQRRHQTVGHAAVRDAFADRSRCGSYGLHRVVDHDAALQCMPADSASAVFGRMPAAITTSSAGICMPSLETNRGDTPRPPAISASVCFSEQERRPRSSSDFCSIRPATSSSWRSSNHGTEMDDGHIHAAQLQTVGRLQPEQAATDDDSMTVFLRPAIIASVSAMSR